MTRSVVFRNILNSNWPYDVGDDGGREEKDEQGLQWYDFDAKFAVISHVLSIILITLRFSGRMRRYPELANRILKKK
jgi:hypothetical protein